MLSHLIPSLPIVNPGIAPGIPADEDAQQPKRRVLSKPADPSAADSQPAYVAVTQNGDGADTTATNDSDPAPRPTQRLPARKPRGRAVPNDSVTSSAAVTTRDVASDVTSVADPEAVVASADSRGDGSAVVPDTTGGTDAATSAQSQAQSTLSFVWNKLTSWWG